MSNEMRVQIKEEFGACCIDGTESFKYANEILIPAIRDNRLIVMDFSGVRIMNSSFSNALFGSVFHHFGAPALDLLMIENAKAIVRSEIKSGIAYGIRRSKGDVAA